MSPPLPPATTVRLPVDLTAWLDEKVASGEYKSRSDAIRALLESVSDEKSPPPAASAAMPFEWFVVPLVLLPVHDPHQRMFVFQNDPLAPGIPGSFVPFGLLADGPQSLLEQFMVSDPQIGGGSSLISSRLPLELAGTTGLSWGPSGLLFDRGLPILVPPNRFEVEISFLGTPAKNDVVSPEATLARANLLDAYVMLWSEKKPPEPPFPQFDKYGTPICYEQPTNFVPPTWWRLRDLLPEVWQHPHPKPPTVCLPRIGLLAVRVEHRDELLKRMKAGKEPFQSAKFPYQTTL